jgi:tetratricopeptide (TPR) repeat protein
MLVDWRYVNWANDFVNRQLDVDRKEALALFATGVQLQERYVGLHSTRPEYGRLRQRLANAYRVLGDVHRSAGMLPESIGDFTKAIEIDPKDNQHYFGRGRTHLAASRPDDAIKDFTKVIELRPRYDEGYRFRGINWLLLGQYDRAIDDFTKAIGIDPGDDNYFNGRAWAHFKAGKLEEALKDAEKAVSIVRFCRAHCNDTHGHILRALGRTDDAEAAFAKAKALNPNLRLTADDILRRLAP